MLRMIVNRPIDKSAAIFILNRLKSSLKPIKIKKKKLKRDGKITTPAAKIAKKNVYYGVFDIETQRSAQEVGGWHRADLMKVSCVVLYDSRSDRRTDRAPQPS